MDMPADEFDIIRTLFAPLATAPGARGLLDDAAVFEAHGNLVITTDAIVEGVHFLSDDPIDAVAKKALRVNVSDLVAKGAKPIAALLTLIWPNHRPSGQIADFARGLGEDLAHYDIALLGGDTTSTHGPLTISVTALGAPLGPRIPARGDAKPGQDVWLTGPIGDAYLGLRALREGVDDEVGRALAERYRLPNPPSGDAALIAEVAGASIDVSDGLIADAGKIASASGVALRIHAERAPLSGAARAWLARTGEDALALLSGGDDYQVLLTADPANRERLERAGWTPIGAVGAGAGLELIGADGEPIALSAGGHVHRLGR